MTPRASKTLPGLAVFLLLAGCASIPASTTPELDKHFGSAVNLAKARQILNPEASRDTDPVAGIDGKAAAATSDRYEKSFKEPPPTMNVINIGGPLAGGQ